MLIFDSIAIKMENGKKESEVYIGGSGRMDLKRIIIKEINVYIPFVFTISKLIQNLPEVSMVMKIIMKHTLSK